jgi:hypothetical protein
VAYEHSEGWGAASTKIVISGGFGTGPIGNPPYSIPPYSCPCSPNDV